MFDLTKNADSICLHWRLSTVHVHRRPVSASVTPLCSGWVEVKQSSADRRRRLTPTATPSPPRRSACFSPPNEWEVSLWNEVIKTVGSSLFRPSPADADGWFPLPSFTLIASPPLLSPLLFYCLLSFPPVSFPIVSSPPVSSPYFPLVFTPLPFSCLLSSPHFLS